MDEGKVRISPTEVAAVAAAIRAQNTTMDGILTEIGTKMRSLEGPWQSEASDTIRAKFEGLRPKMEEYKTIIESYAKFLDNAVQSWQNTDMSINTNAQQFK